MSAATRGFELPLRIKDATLATLRGIRIGTRLSLKMRICGSSNERFSIWYVKSIQGDKIIVAPINNLDNGCGGNQKILTISELLSKFRILPRNC